MVETTWLIVSSRNFLARPGGDKHYRRWLVGGLVVVAAASKTMCSGWYNHTAYGQIDGSLHIWLHHRLYLCYPYENPSRLYSIRLNVNSVTPNKRDNWSNQYAAIKELDIQSPVSSTRLGSVAWKHSYLAVTHTVHSAHSWGTGGGWVGVEVVRSGIELDLLALAETNYSIRVSFLEDDKV